MDSWMLLGYCLICPYCECKMQIYCVPWYTTTGFGVDREDPDGLLGAFGEHLLYARMKGNPCDSTLRCEHPCTCTCCRETEDALYLAQAARLGPPKDFGPGRAMDVVE